VSDSLIDHPVNSLIVHNDRTAAVTVALERGIIRLPS